MNNDTPVGAASVEIDGELFTFAGDLEKDTAVANRALASGVEVLDARAPYSPKLPTSYFGDLRNAQRGDADAVERLRQHAELRDLTSTTATAGSEFAAPEYLRQTYVEAIRSSAPLLNILTKRPLPEEGSSVVVPKLSTGASVASQQDGGALSETDPVTSSITLPIVTVGGFVDISTQLFERSGPGLDEVIATDLARAYYERLDSLAITGSGTAGQPVGLNATTGETVTTYTSASPTFEEVLAKIASAYSAVSVARKLAPDTILMHPRRWAWLSSQTDTTDRPIISPAANGPMNAGGVATANVAEGETGRILGLPVILDPNILTTSGSGTNEDQIYVLRRDDLIFHESAAPRYEVFEDTLSGTLQVRLRIYGYSAFSPDARPESIARIIGTGLSATV